tara:strand:- start:352 stop:918 length:567 start_codon:yes stop_codon:yes gene_type:complete
MKKILIILSFFLIHHCSKPKSVLICGDHVCVNNSEAEQYFEDNLSIEVKIIDSKEKDEIDLIELNLRDNSSSKRKVSVVKKDKTDQTIKILNNEEIMKIKKKIKENNKEKKIAKKILNENSLKKKTKLKKKVKIKRKNTKKKSLDVNKNSIKVVDICTILEKCSIDEISKYLLNQGKKRKFPDITTRE